MQAFFFRLLLRLNAMLSLPMSHRLGSYIGWLLIIFPNRQKHVARINIARCFPELNPQQQKQLLHNNLLETGKTLCEMGIIWLANTEKVLSYVTAIEGEEHLQQALDKNNGVLLALPHLGSWELVNLYTARHYPLTSLYKPQRLAAIDKVIKTARQRTGASLVPTDTRGVRQLSRTLKQGEIVLILPDQQPPRVSKSGIFSDFFGIPAYSMTLMSKLAASCNSEIVYAYARREKHGRGFTLCFMPASENTDKKNLQHSVDLMNIDIEKVVRDCPEQYQWNYKRFRYRPDGMDKIY